MSRLHEIMREYGAQTRQEIREFVEKQGRKPSYGASTAEERRLGRALCNYCNPSSNSFNAELRTFLEEKGLLSDSREQRVSRAKQRVFLFVKEYRRLPKSGNGQEELRVYMLLWKYGSHKSRHYTAEFAHQVMEELRNAQAKNV